MFDIRVDAVRRQTGGLLRKAGLMYELPEEEGDLSDDNVNNG